MLEPDLFRKLPALKGEHVTLEPLGPEHLDGYWGMLSDPKSARLTGSLRRFLREQAEAWLATRGDNHDRADWAIVRRDDGRFLGEAVIFGLDLDNACADFRIALTGPGVFDRGYGTEATRLVVGYALDEAGLHRLGLEVFSFNTRAQRVYEKCGFVREGVRREALLWEGSWHDVVLMSILQGDPRPA